jgi:uncharacterized protein YpuA (DUF1002 family)
VPKVTAARSIWRTHGSELVTEMSTMHNLDDVVTPEMTAKAWDDYLQRCGAGEYISARYSSSVREVTLSPPEPPLVPKGLRVTAGKLCRQ